MPKISTTQQSPAQATTTTQQADSEQLPSSAGGPPPMIRQNAMDPIHRDQFVPATQTQRFTPEQVQQITLERKQTLADLRANMEERAEIIRQRDAGPKTKEFQDDCTAQLIHNHERQGPIQQAAVEAQNRYYKVLEQQEQG